MTDQEWEQMVQDKKLPKRPEWTNNYLAGNKGETKEPTIELPAKIYTSINQIEGLKKDLQVYPNPVSNQLTLLLESELNTEVDISVYNTTGVLLQRKIEPAFAGENRISISLTGLSEGMYVVKTELKGEYNWISKIIKK